MTHPSLKEIYTIVDLFGDNRFLRAILLRRRSL